jgi:hypothetical protein
MVLRDLMRRGGAPMSAVHNADTRLVEQHVGLGGCVQRSCLLLPITAGFEVRRDLPQPLIVATILVS